MKALTVKDIYKACKEQIEKGNGEKKILLSDDDEGNGYHQCFFEFTEMEKMGDLKYINLPFSIDDKKAKKEHIILG